MRGSTYMPPWRRRPGQPPAGAIAQLTDGALGLFLRVKHRDGRPMEHLARLRQPKLGAAPLEERQAQLLLQRLELQAHGRLAQQEVGGGGGDAAALGHRVEDPQVVKIHRDAIGPTRHGKGNHRSRAEKSK